MTEDEERREGSKRSARRDPSRNARPEPRVIEGQAEDVTPPVASSTVASPETAPEMPEPASIDAAVSGPTEESESVSPPAAFDGSDPMHRPEPPAAEPALHDIPLTGDTPAGTAAASGRSPWTALAALGFVVLAGGLLYVLLQLSSLPPDNSAALADLKTRVASVELRPSSAATDLEPRLEKTEHDSAALQAGLDALGKRVDGVAATPTTDPALGDRVAETQAGLAALKTDLEAVKASIAALPRPDISRVDARMGDLDQRLAGLQGVVGAIPRVDLGPLTGKLDSLETRLKPVETEMDAVRSPEQVAQRRAAPLAVTAQAVTDAISAGRAFPRELQALQVLGTNPDRLAPLKAVAENGAPSLRDIQASLADLRDRIIARGAKPATGSYMDRLVAGASGLVQVRPSGSVVGDTPAALVARMDDAIGRDDLAAALADWRRLPDDSQAASKALADRIKLRQDAEQAARTIAADAIGAMTAPRG